MMQWQEFTAALWFRKVDVAPFEGQLASLQQPLVVRARGRLLVALSVSGGFPRASLEAELGALADELLIHAGQATPELSLGALREDVWQKFEAARFDRALPEIFAVAADDSRLLAWRAGPNGVALINENGIRLASEDLRFAALQRQGAKLEERWARDPLLAEISELTQLEPLHAAQQELSIDFRDGCLCFLSRGGLPFGVTSQPEPLATWWRRDAGWRHGMGGALVVIATGQGLERGEAALQALQKEVQEALIANADGVGQTLVDLHRAARQLIDGTPDECRLVATRLSHAGGEAWHLLATLAQDSTLSREVREIVADVLSDAMPRALLESVALSLLHDPEPALRGRGIILCARTYLDALTPLLEQSVADAASFPAHGVEVSVGNLARAALHVLAAYRPDPRFPDWPSVAVGAPPTPDIALPDVDDDAGLSFEFLARRQAMLKLAPENIGLARAAMGQKVFGILMETGYPQGTHTLACLVDGSVHNDFSNGALSGRLSDHAVVRTAVAALLEQAQLHYDAAVPTRRFPRPNVGAVFFYFLGAYEIRRYEALEDALTNDRDPLSDLYHVAHELLAEIYAVERSQAESKQPD